MAANVHLKAGGLLTLLIIGVLQVYASDGEENGLQINDRIF